MTLPIHLLSPTTAEHILSILLSEHLTHLDRMDVENPLDRTQYTTALLFPLLTEGLTTYLALHGHTKGISEIMTAYSNHFGPLT